MYDYILTYFLNLSLALLLGACIGLERQLRQRLAGLRTNTLVSVGAAVFMSLAFRLGGEAPARLASYIISGMGFLGAGVIIKDGASIRGLNTAATLWCTAAVGAMCGSGFVAEPIIATSMIIIIHLALRPISTKIIRRKGKNINSISEEYSYIFAISCKETVENHIRVLIVQYLSNNEQLILHAIDSRDTEVPDRTLICAEILSFSKQDLAMEKIASFLTLERDVLSVKWEVKNLDMDML